MLNSEMSDPMLEAQVQGASDQANFPVARRKCSGYTSDGDGSPDGKSDVNR